MFHYLSSPRLDLDCFVPYDHIREFYPIQLTDQALGLSLWTDIDVEIHRDHQGQVHADYASADKISDLQIHHSRQWQGFVSAQEYQHYKILAPWFCRANRPVKFQMVPSLEILNLSPVVTVLPGHLDFVYQSAMHVNTLWHVGTEGVSQLLQAGLPLVRLVPLTPVRLRVHCHSVTMEEYHRLTYTPKFGGLYRERVVRQKQHGCPFA